MRDFAQDDNVLVRVFPFWNAEFVNRQNLHDWAHAAVSKPKILLAILSGSAITL